MGGCCKVTGWGGGPGLDHARTWLHMRARMKHGDMGLRFMSLENEHGLSHSARDLAAPSVGCQRCGGHRSIVMSVQDRFRRCLNFAGTGFALSLLSTLVPQRMSTISITNAFECSLHKAGLGVPAESAIPSPVPFLLFFSPSINFAKSFSRKHVNRNLQLLSRLSLNPHSLHEVKPFPGWEILIDLFFRCVVSGGEGGQATQPVLLTQNVMR